LWRLKYFNSTIKCRFIHNSVELGNRSKIILSGAMLFVFTFFIFIENSYAIVSDSDTPLIVFENISVDENPVPNVPFEISVTVRSPALTSDLFLFLRLPNDISVLSPAVVELSSRNTGGY